MSERHAQNVLFLCTGNSARSIIAEVLLRRLGGERFHAFSAGSHPKGAVNPLTLRILEQHGESTEGLRSKSWDELAAPGAPPLDFVITVCSQATGETCPIWPGRPAREHWDLPDPAAVEGPEPERLAAFHATYLALQSRLDYFLSQRGDR